MKNILKLSFLSILWFVSGSLLWSQEGLDLEKTLIKSYVETEDPTLHKNALAAMEERWKRQGFLDDDLTKILIAMAASSIRTEVYEEGILVKTNQDVQLKSIDLLGKIGGQTSLDTMTDLIDKSREYPIVLEAVNCSANIQADDYSDFLLKLSQVMKNQHYTKLDNAFAYTALFTLNSLLENYNTVLTPDLIKVVLIYSESAYIQKVRDLARAVLMKY